MHKIKRKLRLLLFIFLLFLAIMGIGIEGGIPIPASGRKEEIVEIYNEEETLEEEEESDVKEVK